MTNIAGLAVAPALWTASTKVVYDRYLTTVINPKINTLNAQINGKFGALQTKYSSHHQGGKVDATYYYGTMFYKHANGTTVTVNSFSSGAVGISGNKKSFTSAELAAGEAKRQAAISTWNNTTKPALIVQRDALIAQRTRIQTTAKLYAEEELAVMGQNISRVSFVTAFNKQVGDRINAVTKWSTSWYESTAQTGTVHTNASVWNSIKAVLAAPASGEFGIMQAGANPTVAQLQAAVSPNDPNGAAKKAAGQVAVKNAMYSLKDSVAALSRVKELKISIYWESNLEKTVLAMAITNRAQLDGTFLYKYGVENVNISEANLKTWFNQLRTDLIAQQKVNRDLRVDYCHSSCHSAGRSRR